MDQNPVSWVVSMWERNYESINTNNSTYVLENQFEPFYQGRKSSKMFPFYRQKWTLTANPTFVYIENLKTDKVLAVNGTEVTEQNKNVENNLNQMWIKGTMNKEGFFTLSNSGKFLSVISRDEDLEMKGIHFKLYVMLKYGYYSVI